MVAQVIRKSIVVCLAVLTPILGFGAEWDGEDVFPLMAWLGPPLDKGLLNRYHRAGFTYMPMPPDGAWAPIVETIQAANMQALTVLTEGPDSNMAVAVNFGTAQPNGAGWFVGHEVAAPHVERYLPVLASLTEIDRKREKFMTLLTSGSRVEWEEKLPALAKEGMTAFAFHHFFMPDTGDTDEAGMFSLMELGRELGGPHGAEIWGMVQVTPFDGYRRTSESDIRLQAYSQLACGARGLVFFSFWAPANVDSYELWGPPMINPETRASEYGYDMVRMLNRELRILTPYMERLSHRSSYFFGSVPIADKELPLGETPFVRVEGQHGLVGYFEGEDGDTWALLVNRRHAPGSAAKTRKATFLVLTAEDVAGVTEIDRYTGYEKPVPIEDGRFSITIPGGTGSLLRLEMRGEGG